MKKSMILVVYIFFLTLSSGWAQTSHICVYFEPTDDCITIKMNGDSTYTHFSIVKKDTKMPIGERAYWIALDRLLRWEGLIFFTDYFSLGKPITINGNDVNCDIFLSLKGFRSHNYNQRGLGPKPQVVFLEKISENSFLKWKVQLQMKL